MPTSLLYAYDSSNERHEPCRRWLTGAFNGPEEVGLSLVTVLAFLRIATQRQIWTRPLEISDAITIIRTWIGRTNVRLLGHTAAFWSTLESVAVDADARGPLLMDAHLAALAMDHGATIVTTDRDFRRFADVRLVDPTDGWFDADRPVSP